MLISNVLFLQFSVIFSGLVLDPHPHAAADHVTDAGPGHVTAAGQGRARGRGGSDGEVREKCDSDQRLFELNYIQITKDVLNESLAKLSALRISNVTNFL